MLYTPPEKVVLDSKYDKVKNKHCRMAIWFDNNFYKNPKNHFNLYRYLYCIISMLAYKQKFFKTEKEYENFAICSTTTLYVRFMKQEQLNYPHIKSVLNYVKSALIGLLILYQNNFFLEVSKPHINTSKVEESYNYNISYNNILTIYDEIHNIVQLAPKYIKNVINKFTLDNTTKKKLYISTILTFNKILNRYYKIKKYQINEYLFDVVKDNIVLWNLKDIYINYVIFIINNIKVELSSAIKETINYYQISDIDLNNVKKNLFSNIIVEENYEK